MSHSIHSVLLAAALSAGAAAQVTLTEIATIDLTSTSGATNAEYIGTNPSAVAWNGTDLFVAGYNNNPSLTNNCSIIQVLNPLGGTPTFGTPFGTVATPFFRGYSGLDIRGTRIAASYDDGAPGGVQPAQGIAAYDFSGTQLWTKATRGGSGVGFDPGTPGGSTAGQGVGWTTFGSGRRALQNAATGADIWTTANGMVILTPEGTFWRDMDFDDATGDIWLREGNNVIQGVRSGDNSVSAMNVVVDVIDADFINTQNIAFCNTPTGDFVIYNDRATNSVNQGFFQTVLAIRPDGTPLTLDFGSFNPQPGNAGYDFSYDAGTNTLAILDFHNRAVTVFQVTFAPYYQYGSGCPGSNGRTMELSATGAGTVGTILTYQVRNGVANGTAFILLGLGQGTLNLYPGCDVLLSPILPVNLGPFALDGTGAGTARLNINGGSGGTLTSQAVMIDLGLGIPLPFILSNGLRHDIP